MSWMLEMRALQVENHDHRPVFSNILVPSISPSQVLIQTEACGLNFADLLMIEGVYQETPMLPFSLGMEVAGNVLAVGNRVTDIKVGDRVVAFTGSGGLAEFCAVDISRCLKIPTDMSYETAASVPIGYGTSHLSLTHRAKIKPGDKLLVLGAGGGVGLTAVEIGAALGAKVIAVARGKDKMKICKTRGAEITLDSTVDDVGGIVKKLGGVDIVYDPVGGDPFLTALSCCKPEARYLIIGFASGNIPQIKANHLLLKNVNIMGFYWGGYLRHAPEALVSSLNQILNLIVDGNLKPYINKVYEFDQALEALGDLKARKSIGKLIVRGPKSNN
ncbi:MAG: NADPH:quinone oxidoreductase family protein [Planktomarina sp.]|nr:NADPH:quinone oxidoreductase family protein [Planktomarina sp.]